MNGHYFLSQLTPLQRERWERDFTGQCMMDGKDVETSKGELLYKEYDDLAEFLSESFLFQLSGTDSIFWMNLTTIDPETGQTLEKGIRETVISKLKENPETPDEVLVEELYSSSVIPGTDVLPITQWITFKAHVYLAIRRIIQEERLLLQVLPA